jgi:hypothetical protein
MFFLRWLVGFRRFSSKNRENNEKRTATFSLNVKWRRSFDLNLIKQQSHILFLQKSTKAL